MKTKILTLIGVLALVGLGIAWYFNLHDGTETHLSTSDKALTPAMNECDAITEKAAQNLLAVVEFQKLEIIGRKARVYKVCMNDHGYIENPVWTKSMASVADKKAKVEKISSDEAFENLRRENMVLLNSPHDQPAYWLESRKRNASNN